MTATIEAPARLALRPEVKAAWLDALRSGEYKQVANSLCKDDGFCCLGVLTDLAVKGGVGWWEDGTNGRKAHVTSLDQRHEHLPAQSVVDWAFGPGVNMTGEGLWAKTEVTDKWNHPVALYGMNDGFELPDADTNADDYESTKYTFAQIADVIEANY